MAKISKKKPVFKVSGILRKYLKKFNREVELPILYTDLARYENSIALFDKNDEDTLWETVFYPQHEMADINDSLKMIYAILKADGDLSVMKHLIIDRVDLCVYGNTMPYRVRVVNSINDNFDYFYVKTADASRIYGLELEHLLSPNRISYLVHGETLIEEHIVGIPGDMFIDKHLKDKDLNATRLAKEFVKFNERCFVRLLGDMHSSNFVVDVTPDFDDMNYRIRAIDFDQQSFEGKMSIYMPKYFKRNRPIIDLGMKNMAVENMIQYQKEERTNIAMRVQESKGQIMSLLKTMQSDTISTKENVDRLSKELAHYYKDDEFLNCKRMGDLVYHSLNIILSADSKSAKRMRAS